MTSAVTADARKTMKSLYRAPEPDVLKPLLDRAAQLDSIADAAKRCTEPSRDTKP